MLQSTFSRPRHGPVVLSLLDDRKQIRFFKSGAQETKPLERDERRRRIAKLASEKASLRVADT